MSASKQTPMMQQYFEVKRGLPRDTLLLFRLGDFFELFFDDAVVASKLLGLTLTKRIDHPMAGLPAHALDTYVNKLLAAGRKVAICDQTEPARAGKLVRRQLTRILSPGTTLAASQLDAVRNHYLAASPSIAADCTPPGWTSRPASSGSRAIPTSPTCSRSSPRSIRRNSSSPRANASAGPPRRTSRWRSTPCTRSAPAGSCPNFPDTTSTPPPAPAR
jgi:hypothetical protein